MLGDAVRTERKRKGLTQAQLAQMSGVSKRTILALEQGGNASRNVIQKVVGVLGMSEVPLDNVVLTHSVSDYAALAPILAKLQRATSHMSSANEQILTVRAELETLRSGVYGVTQDQQAGLSVNDKPFDDPDRGGSTTDLRSSFFNAVRTLHRKKPRGETP
jgi:transcriptional regulator with XRE-family HTH domain